MKKLYALVAAAMITATTFAQAPSKMSYQAVVRDAADVLVTNQAVGMQVSILQGSFTGTPVYVETHSPSTNINGLVSIEIGSGTVVSGIFNNIDWGNGPFFIKTETDPTGGTSYTITGTSQLLSVPYALRANIADSVVGGVGATGPQGPIGLTGPQGLKGDTGAVGPQGPTGSTGPQGLKGDTGVAGPQGIQGLTGAVGPQGAIGLIGPQGIQGLTGPQGLKGDTGVAGPQGAIGLIGPQGLKGDTGVAGPQGLQGLLSNGTTPGNTPYWDGSQWVVNSSNFHNNGSGIGMGTNTPNSSAKLEIASTTQGFLPPRMTTTQRDAIAAPALGLVIYNTTTNCLNFYIGTSWNETCGTVIIPLGNITTLNCVGATNSGILDAGIPASGVSSSISYIGGNGGTHSGQIINSMGVTGLTATLPSGAFTNASGSLNYTITGTPNTNGTAVFALNIGGQTCTLSRSVSIAIGTYPTGSVFCTSGATTVVDVTNPATGKTWMDRNLGASQVAASSTDANSFGDLYQWGRRSDGHQCRNSSTIGALSSTDRPTHGGFILATSSPDDWRSPQNTNLWQGVSGVNNPCPSGYRLPTEIELNAERLSWSTNTSAGAFASPLKLTLAGFRNYGNGNLVSVYGTGFYWSSTVNGADSYALYFNNPFLGGLVRMITSSRAYGSSVRCLKN